MGKIANKIRKCLSESPFIKRNLLKLIGDEFFVENSEMEILTELCKCGFFGLYANAFSIDGKGILLSGHGREGKTPLMKYFERNYSDRFKPLGDDSVYLIADGKNSPAILQIPEGYDPNSWGFRDIRKFLSEREVENFTPLNLWIQLYSSNGLKDCKRVVTPGAYRTEAISVAGSNFKRKSARNLLKDRTMNIPLFGLQKPRGYEVDESIPKPEFSSYKYDETQNKKYEKDVARTAKAVERLIAGETKGFSF